MTKEEVKRLEDQIHDLESQVKGYYKDEKAREILKVEQLYLGKVYKKPSENGGTVYLSVVSVLNRNAPYRVNCFEFENPVDQRFIAMGNYMTFRRLKDPFDYGFPGEPFIWFEDEEVKKLEEEYEEIGMQDFQTALDYCFGKIREIATSRHSLEEKLGGNYVQKISTP